MSQSREEVDVFRRELTLDGLRRFVEESKQAPGDIPVVVNVILEFADEVKWRKDKEKLEVATEVPIRAASISIQSYAEEEQIIDDKYIPSSEFAERTNLCTITLNVVSARHMLREDVDAFGEDVPPKKRQ